MRQGASGFTHGTHSIVCLEHTRATLVKDIDVLHAKMCTCTADVGRSAHMHTAVVVASVAYKEKENAA